MEEAQAYRKLHDVRIKGFSGDMDTLAPFTSFDTLPFSPSLVQSLRRQGFSAPTAIQAQSWPIAVLKRDMISIARTGSGKTCAFLLPALQAISQTPLPAPPRGDERDRARRRSTRRVPRALVLAPTRELAQQIEREAAKYTAAVGITAASFYGGTPKGPQMRQLSRGVDVVVATPGRCNDLVETGALDLRQVDYLVLDEADRMLDMG
jgi:ATP-dependent RNA helicase DDX5/DBP2